MVEPPSSEKTLDISDASSDTTLIDLEHASVPVNVTENGAAHVDSIEEDGVMVDSENLSPGTDSTFVVPERPPPVPPRNKSGLSIETRKTRTTTADDELWKFGSQQDVTEVIGNVMFRLQCAIKPTSFDESTGEQIDSVRDTFYGANAVYLRKSQVMEKKVEPWANLIVFPAPTGPRDIYEALDVVFDEQIVEIDNTTTPQHASIAKLPPVLQIQIQRTAYDPVKQTAWKNRNAVVFPETIYLDRYMDSSDHNSTLMSRRRQAWEWKSELRSLEARQAALSGEASMAAAEALMEVKKFVHVLQEDEVDEDFLKVEVSEELEDTSGDIFAELEGISEQVTSLKQKLNEQFTNMHEYEYKLQTVFIHRGEAGGGHYWIYIYDFENDVWREYNDEHVTVVNDRRRIFEHSADSGGTPYYLAYVRSADKRNLVDAVCREVTEEPMEDVPGLIRVDQRGAILEEEEDDETRHVENVTPRNIWPKGENLWDRGRTDAAMTANYLQEEDNLPRAKWD